MCKVLVLKCSHVLNIQHHSQWQVVNLEDFLPLFINFWDKTFSPSSRHMRWKTQINTNIHQPTYGHKVSMNTFILAEGFEASRRAHVKILAKQVAFAWRTWVKTSAANTSSPFLIATPCKEIVSCGLPALSVPRSTCRENTWFLYNTFSLALFMEFCLANCCWFGYLQEFHAKIAPH